MRIPAALSVALTSLSLAQLATAQAPAHEPPPPASPPEAAKAAPAPAPAPASSSTQPLADPALIAVPAEPDQPQLEPIADAHDTLGGHLVIGAAAGAKWPLGSLEDGRKQSSYLGTGWGFNLDVGFGLGRNLVLGLWGEYDAHRGHSSSCTECSSASSMAAGPFLRYHLVQGTRFDPWGQLGVGVRYTHTDPPSSDASANYFGPEILKLALGGDWYPVSKVGIGPYLTFDLGTFGSTVHTGLGTGLRLVLDFPGK